MLTAPLPSKGKCAVLRRLAAPDCSYPCQHWISPAVQKNKPWASRNSCHFFFLTFFLKAWNFFPQVQVIFYPSGLKVENQEFGSSPGIPQLPMVRGMHEAVCLLTKGASGCWLGIWNVLLSHNCKWHEIESCGKLEEGGATGLLSCCSTAVELRAKCLFHPLRSRLDRVTYCWPHLSPAITFNSIFVRHHEAKEKPRGVNQASVYSSVFLFAWFYFFHCTVFFPSPTCRKSNFARKPGSTSCFRGGVFNRAQRNPITCLLG